MKKLTILAIASFCVLVALSGYYIYDGRLGDRKMIALLNGDRSIVISSFAIKYQQRRVRCTDGEILQWIARAMAKHPRQMTNVGKFSYYGYFKFKGGGTFGGYMQIDTNGFALSVSSLATEEGTMTHSVLLGQMTPGESEPALCLFGGTKSNSRGHHLGP